MPSDYANAEWDWALFIPCRRCGDLEVKAASAPHRVAVTKYICVCGHWWTTLDDLNVLEEATYEPSDESGE
jgi:hypothetical protein